MALTTEILRSWRSPRAATRRQLDGATEARALMHLMVACLLIFVAQWPRLAREAELAPEVPLDARVGATLMAWMFIMPLVLYAVAGLSHVVARALGGRASWLGARVALFWSLLASAPLFLLYGLVAGFIGAGAAMTLTGAVLTAGFLGHWLLALVEVEGFGAA